LSTRSAQAKRFSKVRFFAAWALSETSDPSEKALGSFAVRQTSAV
jgi:hypothetical protein